MAKLTLESMSTYWYQTILNKNISKVEIDIQGYTFITHSALISLSSLIEFYLSEKKDQISIILPIISDKFLNDQSAMFSLRNKDSKYVKKYFETHSIFMTAKEYYDDLSILRFMSFLYNSGFVELWEEKFVNNRVVLNNLHKNLIKEFFIYSGKQKIEESPSGETISLQEYSRYSKIKRIFDIPLDSRKSILKNIVNELYEKLPQDQKDSPLFNDNEFEEIFLEQLSDNVEKHAIESSAYVMVRSFSKDDIKNYSYIEYLLPEFDDQLKKVCSLYGFFEINISDHGLGIDKTLYKAYNHVLKSIFNKELSFSTSDVISFSLDEFGSRYILDEEDLKSLIDEHSLNQVLKYTTKYGGHLRILSNDCCINYDTSKFLNRGKWGIGFSGVEENGDYFQRGTNLRIILPHTNLYNCNYPKSRSLNWVFDFPNGIKMPHAKYIGIELSNTPSKDEIYLKINDITRWAILKRIDKLVLDFSGIEDWEHEMFLFFIEKLQNLTSSILIWGVNVPTKILGNLSFYMSNISNFQPFPCIDDSTDKNLYFISKNTFNISNGLSILIKDVIDSDGSPLLIPYQIDDIANAIKEGDGVRIESVDLLNILVHSSNLFVFDKKNNHWTSILSYSEIVNSSLDLLQQNFKELLIKTGTIHQSNEEGRETIYLLPSSKKKVKEFLWTYNLLQFGHHTEEISTKFIAIFSRFFIEKYDDLVTLKNFDVIVCATAPARIIAEALSIKFGHNPMVVDLGGINCLDPEEILSSLSDRKIQLLKKKLKCLIVTDVLDTNNLIRRIFKLLAARNCDVIGVAALIKFDKKEWGWVGEINEMTMSTANGEEKVPIAVLYKHTQPEELEGPTNKKIHNEYLIEPYSLRPIWAESLYDQFYAWEYSERTQSYTMPERIANLDYHECLIYGHFRDKNHHNRLMINMTKTLLNDEIANDICNDIIQFIINDLPVVIIVPLHSNIHHLIPRLKVKLREIGQNIPVICTISIDLRGRGPFYILPDEARRIMINLNNNKNKIMFLDDGLLTGRTVETFFRDISKFKRREPKELKRQIDTIYIYCIVNRVGRAATEKWREIKKVLDNTNFKFREYIRFEYPVFSSNDCPLCKHLDRLAQYSEYEYYLNPQIQKWAKNEMEFYESLIINSPEQINWQTKKLPFSRLKNNFVLIDKKPTTQRQRMTDREQVTFVRNPTLSSVEGAVWWLWERSYRGTPAKFLLCKFFDWVNARPKFENHLYEKLICELLLWAIENIDDFKTPALLKDSIIIDDQLCDELLNVFVYFLNTGSPLIPRVLEITAAKLLKRKSLPSLDDLVTIIKIAISSVNSQTSSVNVLNLILGIDLIIHIAGEYDCLDDIEIIISQHIASTIQEDDKWEKYFANTLQFLNMEYSFALLSKTN
jgi:adenine/guanine phosphoribosyltransferase-like PRPP-binding protein